MLVFGNALFPDKIGVHEAEEYLNRRISAQIANYEMEYNRLTELEHLTDDVTVQKQVSQSETDFKMEIEKMVERSMLSEKERQEQKQMTAWDYRRQGDRCYNLGQYAEAVDSYSTAIDMQPESAQFYNDRGCTYNRLEEYNKAISDLDKAIELDPKFASAYNNRGYAYDRLEEYDKAISDFKKSIELDPKQANPYKHYGVIWKKRGDFAKALELITKAIELDPKYKKAFKVRAEVYRSLGKIAEAEADEATAEEL